MELKMELSQKQVLSQHMVQSMEILQMSAQELEGYIEKLALENPVIELADSSQSKADMRRKDLHGSWTGWSLQTCRIVYVISRSVMRKIWKQTGMTADSPRKIWRNICMHRFCWQIIPNWSV